MFPIVPITFARTILMQGPIEGAGTAQVIDMAVNSMLKWSTYKFIIEASVDLE